MSIMECPHCDEQIDTVTRTGENRYSCGDCNMVIAHDDLAPYLDELTVIDKRDEASGGGGNNSGNQGGGNAQPDAAQDMSGQTAEQGISDREKIYQRGTEGLKEIKKERLKNWLTNTEGVGGQTESRILMVFNRNETIHQNPHILYNLLDDELSASPSYINTMVEDIFQPERENEDLLQSQGYTPWHVRNSGGGQQMQRGGGGQPFNATGNAGGNFSPGGGQGMQQEAGGMGQQGQQQNNPQSQNNGGNSNSGGSSGISREEAAELVQRGIEAEDQRGGGNRVRDSLSDATDQAIQEMATNVGGLAGTVQKVIDEALVEYARQNPEWVINNMGFLQKMMNATEDGEGEGVGAGTSQPETDAAVDSAISDISGSEPSPDPDPQPRSQPQQTQPPQQEQQSASTGGGLEDFNTPGPEGSGYTPNEEVQETPDPTEVSKDQDDIVEPNPKEIENGMSASPPAPEPEDPGSTAPDREFEDSSEEDVQTEPDTGGAGESGDDDQFEQIFGDVTE